MRNLITDYQLQISLRSLSQFIHRLAHVRLCIFVAGNRNVTSAQITDDDVLGINERLAQLGHAGGDAMRDVDDAVGVGVNEVAGQH